jgi:hypothetical protein
MCKGRSQKRRVIPRTGFLEKDVQGESKSEAGERCGWADGKVLNLGAGAGNVAAIRLTVSANFLRKFPNGTVDG